MSPMHAHMECMEVEKVSRGLLAYRMGAKSATDHDLTLFVHNLSTYKPSEHSLR